MTYLKSGGLGLLFLVLKPEKKVLDQCKSATGRGTPLNNEKLVKNEKAILAFSKKTPTYSLCWASGLGGPPRTLVARRPWMERMWGPS